MGRKDIIGASDEDVDTFPCDWKNCSGKHEEPDQYTSRSDLLTRLKTGKPIGWPKPHNFENVYNVNTPSGSSKRQGSFTNGTYPTQEHHVIPISSFKENLPELKNNLVLKAWNINDERNNGIVLPWFEADIFWHDLQCHSGLPDDCHNDYTQDIISKLGDVQTATLELCGDDEQDTIDELMFKFVTKIRNKIINWKIIVYPSVSTDFNRIASFKKAGLSAPLVKPSGRMLPYK